MLSILQNRVSEPFRIIPRAATFRRTLWGMAAVGGLFLVPGIVHAQVPTDIGAQIGEQLSKQLSEAFSKMLNRKMTVSPAITHIDTKTKTATLQISNGTEDTLEADVTVGLAPAQMLGGKQTGGAKQAGGLLADDEETDPAKSDSVDAKWSLVPWVKGLPSRLKLAPGEKKELTFQLEVPADAAPGEYSAWVVVATDAPKSIKSKGGDGTQQGGGITFNFAGSGNSANGKPMKIPSGAKLVYRVDAK